MPVTVRPFSHLAEPVGKPQYESIPEGILQQASPEESQRCKQILQSSFDDELGPDTRVNASRNGLVYSALLAYKEHHHLVIRPEDIWFAILTQISFYLDRHAEELRDFFVSHQGKKELTVETDAVTLDKVDFGAMAREMAEVIGENVKDPELRVWVMPSFTTTTDDDRTVSAVCLMGAMQSYFQYTFAMPRCGIPSITLLGVKQDYEDISKRLDMLDRLGDEPKQFAKLLRPVLKHMILSFEDPNQTKVMKFWQTMVHEVEGFAGGCGPWSRRGYPPHLSGWLTAFCFWNTEGWCLYQKPKGFTVDFKGTKFERAGCNLDGVVYHRLTSSKIPRGSAAVPVTLVDPKGKRYGLRMVAGSVGWKVTDSKNQESFDQEGAPPSVAQRGGLSSRFGLISRAQPSTIRRHQGEGLSDTLQPVSGWWIYLDILGTLGCTQPQVVQENERPKETQALLVEPQRMEQSVS